MPVQFRLTLPDNLLQLIDTQRIITFVQPFLHPFKCNAVKQVHPKDYPVPFRITTKNPLIDCVVVLVPVKICPDHLSSCRNQSDCPSSPEEQFIQNPSGVTHEQQAQHEHKCGKPPLALDLNPCHLPLVLCGCIIHFTFAHVIIPPTSFCG